jgi:hypothetical protein
MYINIWFMAFISYMLMNTILQNNVDVKEPFGRILARVRSQVYYSKVQ